MIIKVFDFIGKPRQVTLQTGDVVQTFTMGWKATVSFENNDPLNQRRKDEQYGEYLSMPPNPSMKMITEATEILLENAELTLAKVEKDHEKST